MALSRARAAWNRTTAIVATVTGTAMRMVSLSGMSVGGAILISFGLGEIYRPLMFISAGLFLLLADRKQAIERKDRR